mgnify:CR=1 FL=1
MSHIGSILYDDDCIVFDSGSGKCYPTLFDLEQDFWLSKIYQSGDLPDPPDIEQSSVFTPIPMTFKPAEMDMDTLIEDITPTWTQRVDGVWIVGFNSMPTPANLFAIMADDIF